MTAAEGACAAAGVAAWAALLYALFTNEVTSNFALGRKVIRDTEEVKAILLPVVGVVWSAVTLGGFVAWRFARGAVDTSGINHTYFAVGWSETLILFGIRINTFWSYTVIACYQVGRGVLVALIDQLFTPLVAEAQSASNAQYKEGMDERVFAEYSRDVLACQALSKILSWWSSVTDIMFAMSQIDLAILPVVAGATVAGLITHGRIQSARHEALRAPPLLPELLVRMRVAL